MTCYLIVKSDTKLVDREKFDNWYEKEHLSEAREAFMAKSAKRGWIKDSNFHLLKKGAYAPFFYSIINLWQLEKEVFG